MIRFGVYVNGRFSWVHEDGWTHNQKYKPASLVGKSTIRNESLQIEIELEESVSHQSNSFVRRMLVRSLSNDEADVRLFFSHDLRIMESDIGDTAFYHPELHGVVHYKGPCYFLFGGQTDKIGIQQYATGLKGFQHFEGTWRDAEDGQLSNNPIAQGSVDSTIGFNLKISPKSEKDCTYWIVAAEDLDSLEHHFRDFRSHKLHESHRSTEIHWTTWLKETAAKVQTLPPRLVNMCEQSLLLVRTHIDNGGAIIAATDSDIMETNRANYCYMWPRDGALISGVLDKAGQHHLPRAFFEFCARILPKDQSILRQKYTADGKLGATWHPYIVDGKPSTPFQEDETAVMVSAIWDHHLAFNDLEALKQHYAKFVKPAADFMVAHRDVDTGLPKPSYDIWEERLGIHTYTVATVIAGLDAASIIAKEIGENGEEWSKAAGQMRTGLQRMVDPLTGVFVRRLISEGRKLRPDWTVDSSTLSVGLLGVLAADDPRVKATAAKVEEKLWVHGLGGVARYEGDYYFRRHDNLPGNPWIICTCWLAQQKIMAAGSVADLARPLELIEWCCERASSTYVLPEQVDAVTGEPLSVSPLTWSHAEFVKTCFDYSEKLKELGG
jgi:GH15 family glucan-1,4-alpha-glucosidase